jgi:hypothetical protein
MNGNLVRKWKEIIVAYIEDYHSISVRETDKNHDRIG